MVGGECPPPFKLQAIGRIGLEVKAGCKMYNIQKNKSIRWKSRGSGVFRTTNNGVSSTAVDSGLTNPDVDAFLIDGSTIFAAAFGSE